ncbi:MAG: integrase, partial [Solirubrobacterales bacterium]
MAGAADLVAEYAAWLAVEGRGSVCYRNAAWAFLGRWPDPAGFATEPLTGQLALGASLRPFVTFLMLTGRLRPGYDYLAHRKIGGLLARAGRGRLADDVTTFTAAATDLDYSGLTV